ncbi:lysophosphatidylserine lipase ABHD12-like [Epinephelus lanceolatus]|uniref:lysophosphatidylserine lipase ABHD12-like n=1 Tax=Epinephelus lanceolatus TaxID=310571 RepID=UPI001445CCA3|nr:lysophosphatidylserine lipase ABHD12-like [Epinephelus lanceolatus]
MKIILFVVMVGYTSLPVILYLFPGILSLVIFSHLERIPYFVDLSRPEALLSHTCNFYLNTEKGITVGVWHTLPASQWEGAVGKGLEWYWETLRDGSPVFVYLHGNSGTRALNYRVGLVKVLSAAGYHVFSFDYRGFGDSTGTPSEAGVTHDALYVYNWVKKQSRGPVYLWGHSLGTGVATNAALKIQEQGSVADAVVLYAPFTSIIDLLGNNSLIEVYKTFPGFKQLLWKTLQKNKLKFANNENVKVLESPLLILHSEDDDTVPFTMGLELFRISLQAKKERNRDVPVKMVTYRADLKYDHSFVYLDPHLNDVVRNFLRNL